MTPVLRFVGVGWNFFWRQPALVRAAFLLVFLPLLASYLLSAPFVDAGPESVAVLAVLHLAAIVLLTWGIACVLTVGKRLLQAKSGRTRTSFRAVQGQARSLIVPLLLTDILRACMALLWALPLLLCTLAAAMTAHDRGSTLYAFAFLYPWLPVLGALLAVPPALYMLRTMLAPFVVAYEKIAFRPALARSAQLTKERLPYTFIVAVLLLLLWTPGAVASALLRAFAPEAVATIADPVVTAVLDTFSLVLWLLAMTQYFKALGGKTKAADVDND